MAESFVVVTWDDMQRASEAMKKVERLGKEKTVEIIDAAVVVKDQDGEVKVKEATGATAKRGAVSGGLIGLVIGTVVGGPVVGLALGAAGGALLGKKIEVGIPREKVDAVAEQMTNGSSAIFLHLTTGKQEFLEAAVRQSEGQVVEFDVTDEMSDHVEDMMATYTGHIGE